MTGSQMDGQRRGHWHCARTSRVREQAGGLDGSQSGDGDVQPRVSSHVTIQNECLSHTSGSYGAAAPPHPSLIRRHALNTPHKQQHKCRTAHVGTFCDTFHMRRRGPVCCAWPSDYPRTTSAPRDTRQGTRNTRDQQGGVGGGCNALDYKTSKNGRKSHGSHKYPVAASLCLP